MEKRLPKDKQSGRGYVTVLRRVREAGFQLHLFYLWLPSPELALLRIRYRVESGGHNVPDRDVRRRYDRTVNNLFRLYRPLLTSLHFYDNSAPTPRLIFKDEAGLTRVFDKALYERLCSEAAK